MGESLLRHCVVHFSAERTQILHLHPKWLAIRKLERNTVSILGMLKRSSSPSRSMTSRVTARSMASTLVTSSAPATSTLPARPSMLLVAKRRRARFVTLEDMYPLFKLAKESKDTGGIHDFVEILKLLDKNA